MKKEFTKEDLKKIEKLAKKEGLKGVEDYALKHWKIGQKSLRNLRLENKDLSEAIAKGKNSRVRTKKRTPDKLVKVDWDKIVPNELEPNASLKKFKKEFEARKLEMSKKELRNLDLL